MKSNHGSIIISGGSRGLGFELSSKFLELGKNVVTFSRTKTSEIEILEKKYPESLLYRSCDATDFKSIDGLINEAAQRDGGIHAIINNAAVGQDKLFVHLSEEEIDQLLLVNLKSTIMLTKSVIKKMLLQKTPSHIINISSICGSRGYPGLSVYSATKAALDGLTRSLAKELGERSILVNSVAPGFFLSQMSDSLSTEQTQSIIRRTPTGKLITPDQIFEMIDFLLFKNTNITGQVFTVDGGISS